MQILLPLIEATLIHRFLKMLVLLLYHHIIKLVKECVILVVGASVLTFALSFVFKSDLNVFSSNIACPLASFAHASFLDLLRCTAYMRTVWVLQHYCGFSL